MSVAATPVMGSPPEYMPQSPTSSAGPAASHDAEEVQELGPCLIDVFLPGYTPLAKLATKAVGFDVTYLVSICAAIAEASYFL